MFYEKEKMTTTTNKRTKKPCVCKRMDLSVYKQRNSYCDCVQAQAVGNEEDTSSNDLYVL